MIHDQNLVDRLGELRKEQISLEVFRATGVSIDPIAPSINGGRWAPPPNRDPGNFILYTSLERNGALAEVCSFLADLSPIPKDRPVKVSRLGITASRAVTLSEERLKELGVDMGRYGERDYGATQKIGAALAFLEIDALFAPSARYGCQNLMIFTGNHALTERLDVVDSEHVNWRQWAKENGLIDAV